MITIIENVTINGCEYESVPVQVLGDLGATEDQIALIIADEQAKEAAKQESKKAATFLGATDWKVLRHQDEVALGVPTSLTAEEYQGLLVARREARSKV